MASAVLHSFTETYILRAVQFSFFVRQFFCYCLALMIKLVGYQFLSEC